MTPSYSKVHGVPPAPLAWPAGIAPTASNAAPINKKLRLPIGPLPFEDHPRTVRPHQHLVTGFQRDNAGLTERLSSAGGQAGFRWAAREESCSSSGFSVRWRWEATASGSAFGAAESVCC